MPVAVATAHKLKLLQLCRGGTSNRAPRNTAPRSIALGLRYIRERYGEALIVAYADPIFGELGTIYQSCNAVHIGWTNPKGQAEYVVDGKRMTAWTVRKRYGTRHRLKLQALGLDVQVLPLRPKLRYVLVSAGPERKRRVLRGLETLRRPCPTSETVGVCSMRSQIHLDSLLDSGTACTAPAPGEPILVEV